MRKLLGLTMLAATCVAAETITQTERDKAIQHLNETRAKFLASIKGLSAEQWNFKPGPEVWSVGQVAEHITVSEGTILDLVRLKILAAPANPELAAQANGNDDKILTRLVDRSEKAQAPEFLRPTARWTQADLPAEFESRRAKTIEFIRTSQDDLRGHALPHPVFKAMDAYQWVLLISGHSARHTLQIQEVKANPNFPK
ncbi:MAG: DinB family protein [Acidobacteria bacterium]|nr:DinB family protein [Acidobacteriota bacterium]